MAFQEQALPSATGSGVIMMGVEVHHGAVEGGGAGGEALLQVRVPLHLVARHQPLTPIRTRAKQLVTFYPLWIMNTLSPICKVYEYERTTCASFKELDKNVTDKLIKKID